MSGTFEQDVMRELAEAKAILERIEAQRTYEQMEWDLIEAREALAAVEKSPLIRHTASEEKPPVGAMVLGTKDSELLWSKDDCPFYVWRYRDNELPEWEYWTLEHWQTYGDWLSDGSKPLFWWYLPEVESDEQDTTPTVPQ